MNLNFFQKTGKIHNIYLIILLFFSVQLFGGLNYNDYFDNEKYSEEFHLSRQKF